MPRTRSTFRPSPGKILAYHPPGGLGVRVDSAVYQGYTIPPFYDSLVGKLIVHGKTRGECLMRLKRALDEFVVDGIETTLPLFRTLVREKDIIDGDYHIHWLEEFLAKGGMDGVTLMRAGAWLRRALRSFSHGDFYFIVNNRNHVRIFAPVVHRLIALSQPCIIADIERESGDRGARRELAAAGLSSVGIDILRQQITRRDLLVVANDWYPDVVVETMQLCGRRGVLRIGVDRGLPLAQPDRYRHRRSRARMGRVEPRRVRSPGSRRRLADHRGGVAAAAAIVATPDFAVIAFKDPGPTAAAQQAWLEQTTGACRALGIPFEISCHPSYRLPQAFAASQREFRDLMPEAAVLIAQPSTLVYEAMAAGKPVVLFPAADEPLLEFADPNGAFDMAREPAELPALLRAALAGRHDCRERCRAFFDPMSASIHRSPRASGSRRR